MRQSRVFRAAMLAIGMAACGVGGAALVSRYLEITNHAVLVAAVFSPFMLMAIPLGAAALFAAGRRRAAAGAGTLALIALATQLPTAAGPGHDPESIALRVMSVNTLQGGADAAAVVRAARAADVLSVQELTPSGLKALSANGIDVAFPFRIVKPLDGGSGAGLWSRFPVRESAAAEFEGIPIIARLDVGGRADGGTMPEVTVAVVHLSAPWPWPIEWWRGDIARATTVLGDLDEGAVIAAGDFNSTRDMRQFRRLLAVGYGGVGRSPTFPGDRRWPPLLTIDHILTRGCRSSPPRTTAIPGSDHRAVHTAVHIPR